MTPGETLLVLAGAHVAIAVTPGPNFVLVLQQAARSRRMGLTAASGIWPAGLILASAGMFGLGTLLAAVPLSEIVLRIACGLYLLWLGFRAIRATLRPAVAAQAQKSSGNVWLSGFLTNITNPKAVAYFMSIFAATGAFDLPWLYKIAALVMMPTISLIWYGGIVMVVGSPAMARWIDKSAAWLDRLAGGIMILFGLKLLAQK